MLSALRPVLLVAAAACAVRACGDDHTHSHARRSQPGATPSTSFPSAPLVWGDVNFLATTDSHGWLLGHTKSSQPEPNYSGDFGDFASFVKNMKQKALDKGVDLLLVDSGDLHDGAGITGESNAFPPGEVDGQEAVQIIRELPYDIMAIGNHELYLYPIAYDMYTNFAPKLGGRYLSSNVNITVTDKKSGKAVSVPIGDRFRKFKTHHNRKVTALGVLYDFTGQAANITVQPVAKMINETWFKDAIKEEPDFFLLTGHMPVQKDNWPLVFNAIRAVHPTTPIFIFGGHTHIRDCVQLDSRSMALESGRYMETIGWMSANLDKKGSTAPLTINRKYLDPNPNTYKYHTKSLDFDTGLGLKVSHEITALANKFNISAVFGTAPQDYYLSRAPYPSNQSVISLLTEQVLPTALKIVNPERSATVPFVSFVNSGSQRFDLYKGPFTVNDQYIVSPFDDKFLYFTAPLGLAKKILALLNGSGTYRKRSLEWEDAEEYARGEVEPRFNQWKKAQWEREMAKRSLNPPKANLTLGYVTTDSCPGVGDDTLHTAIPYYSTPNYVSSPLPTGDDSTLIDVIFLDFFETTILKIANSLANGTASYTADTVKNYGIVSTNTVLGIYAKAKWN